MTESPSAMSPRAAGAIGSARASPWAMCRRRWRAMPSASPSTFSASSARRPWRQSRFMTLRARSCAVEEPLMTIENNPPPASEAAPGRRRERARAGRGGTAASLTPLPRLANPWAPIEIFTAAQVEEMVLAIYALLEEGGLEIRSPRARAVYKANGAIVDDETMMVRLGRDIVDNFCGKAPERFVLHARNPARDLHVGGNIVNFGPVNGAPHISDMENGRRYGDIAAFRDILKVTHALGVLHWQGGVVVEPVDLPVPIRHLGMYEAHIELSDIVWAARGLGGVAARDGVEMCAIEHGVSLDDLARRPSLMIVTNVNSPRRVDDEILDCIMVMAEHGQCVVATPFTLMGAMAPVTVAGALVQQTAEALGIIGLVEMIRPGTP